MPTKSVTQSIPLIPAERLERQNRRITSDCKELWDILDQVTDPEIPVLSLWDMGILQNVQALNDGVVVTITPTYSGCPAMDVIKEDIETALHRGGYKKVRIVNQLAPAWTTDWMTIDAQRRLRDYGIAAPDDMTAGSCRIHEMHASEPLQIKCPQCGSKNTTMLSEFGSTACKALMQCNDCAEPFDYFKRI